MSGSDRTCDIRASISNWFALTSAVQEGALARSMTMEGQIDDYVEDGEPADARFHGQGIKLFLSAPRDEDWAAGIGQGVAHVCGAALIEAGVIPKTYEFDGVIEEDQPVQIRFKLSVEAFNTIQQQAYGLRTARPSPGDEGDLERQLPARHRRSLWFRTPQGARRLRAQAVCCDGGQL